jgi:hypothetical protein
MPYQYYNPNPKGIKVGDCAVRAVSKAIGTDWQDAYVSLCAEGLVCKDMPSANYVWGNYLKRFGFQERLISSACPNCTTVAEFAKDNPKGRYVLACQNHVVTCIDGTFFDAWDSSSEVILFFYEKEI